MSLKAYDGMMSRKNIKYIQDEIIKRLDRFREASENHLAEKYAELFYQHVDKTISIIESVKFDAINEDHIKFQIDKIKIGDETTILSYIYQASKILANSSYKNDFTVQLNIAMEAINNKKILIYPNILVNEHRPILLEFLEDWYCQNSTDPDENISKKQWEQRKRDWYDFNEKDGFKLKIQLFEPSHYGDSININFRGEELLNKILEYIPSDEKRLRKIAKNAILNNIEKEAREKGEKVSIWKVIDRLSAEDNTEIEDYIKTHNIVLTKIDKDFIENAKLNYNQLAEDRKEKLNEINKSNE
jgi:hypothetical protein